MSKQKELKTEKLSLRLTLEQKELLDLLQKPLRQSSMADVIGILIEDEAKRLGIKVKKQ